MKEITKRRLTTEHKKKLSDSHKGKKLTEETKKKISDANKGKLFRPMTPELKEKISKTLKVRYKNPEFKKMMDDSENHLSGAKHWNWKGGTSSCRNDERTCYNYRKWRIGVLEKNNYTCQISGLKSNLCVHHINNYRDVSEDDKYDIDNGITLNNEVHVLFHRLYGKFNNTINQIKKFTKYYNSDINKTYKVNNWIELADLIENINPHIYTVIIEGFINNIENGRITNKILYFRLIPCEILKKDLPTKDVELLRDKNVKKTRKLAKKSITKNKGK